MLRRLEPTQEQKSTPLPLDYLKMVKNIYCTHFDQGLKILDEIKPGPFFEVCGEIYSNEIILCASLHHQKQLSATTVYASCDFDPKASAPNIQDLLGACVDAIGEVFEPFLNSNDKIKIAQLTETSLSSYENKVPFQWTKTEVDKITIFTKMDKSNPSLDKMTDDWLKENDPERK